MGVLPMKQICECCDYVMEKASRFTVLDFAVLKTTLFSMGLLVGTYCSQFFKKYQAFLWVITLFSYMFLIYRLFIKGMNFSRD